MKHQDERMFEEVELCLYTRTEFNHHIKYKNKKYYLLHKGFNIWCKSQVEKNDEIIASRIDKELYRNYIESFITWFKSS